MKIEDFAAKPGRPAKTYPPVMRRCVFFIGGYDPKRADAFFQRMQRELKRFEKTWGVVATVHPSAKTDGEIGSVSVTAVRDGLWRVETDFHFLVLDDIVQDDFAKPLPVRVLKYLATFLDYVLTGTALRMFAKTWRFGLYFLYPFAAFCLFCAVAFLVAGAVARFGGVVSLVAAPVAGLTVLWGLLATLGKRWSVTHLMDLWSFSRNYLRGRRPDAEALLQRFAEGIDAKTKAKPFDEIVLVGHSTGGGLILDIAARTIALDPAFAARAPEVSLLTLGSTALKLGMHPAAHEFRRRVQSLVDEPRLKWAEYQCMTDVINFIRRDPVVDMKLRPRPASDEPPFPAIREVRMREGLDAPTYKRIKRNFFRVHYQFVYGNTRRYFYDFFMICFGPFPLARTVTEEKVSPDLTGESVT